MACGEVYDVCDNTDLLIDDEYTQPEEYVYYIFVKCSLFSSDCDEVYT